MSFLFGKQIFIHHYNYITITSIDTWYESRLHKHK